MGSVFFEPWKGQFYEDGLINNKKVLILGASAYCDKNGCLFYQDCALNQNIRQYNTRCPNNNGKPLSLMSLSEFDEDASPTFKKFLKFLVEFTNKEVNYVYEHIAFTNYVQHIIGGRTITKKSDCKPEYLDAFIENIEKLRPDIVIVWGCVVNQPIKNNAKVSVELLDQEGYLFKWKNFNGRDIFFLNTYHPSYPSFGSEIVKTKMQEKFRYLLK